MMFFSMGSLRTNNIMSWYRTNSPYFDYINPTCTDPQLQNLSKTYKPDPGLTKSSNDARTVRNYLSKHNPIIRAITY